VVVVLRISHGAAPARRARSSYASPSVISDTMAPVQSMLDGRLYESKSALRATYRSAGMTEVGNDPAILRPRPRTKPDRRAIKAAIARAFSRAGLGT
jgi:hypothetical protein